MKNQLRQLKPRKLIFIGLLSLVLTSASVSWAQIVVTTNDDIGPGSLRQAILDANADPAPNVITFVPGLQVIRLKAPLPDLEGEPDLKNKKNDTIDGTGAAVVLDGQDLPHLPSGSMGLTVRRSFITVRGLTIQNFLFGGGILVEPESDATTVTGVVIDGNTVKLDPKSLPPNTPTCITDRAIACPRGIFINGGTGLGYVVDAEVTNNTITDARTGILVFGNLHTANDHQDDPGHNTVTVFIDGNTVKFSHQQDRGQGLFFYGSGIGIDAGVGAGSGNQVMATVSNNTSTDNEAEGIVVEGCGSAGGSNGAEHNTVDITIISNTVKSNSATGILVSAAAASGTALQCSSNSVTFKISGNTVSDNTTQNINVSGGAGGGILTPHDVQGIITDNPAIKYLKCDGSDLNPCVGDGIVVTGGPGTGNRVHDITISGNQVSSNQKCIRDDQGHGICEGDGIVVTGGSGTGNMVHDITVSGNGVSNIFDRGIVISGGSSKHSTITRIAVSTNTIDGNLSKGTLPQDDQSGILVTGGSNALNADVTEILIDGNTTKNNRQDGIRVSRGAATNIVSLLGVENNTSTDNSRDGIGISSGVPGIGGTPVSGNQCDGNGDDGIEIMSIGYSLFNNSCNRNVDAGISALGNINGGGNSATRNATCNTPGCF